MSHWVLVPLFLLGYVVFGYWRFRREDIPKQRDKFGKQILNADDALMPKGFTFQSYTLKHGLFWGRGRAVWVDEQGREATLESERL